MFERVAQRQPDRTALIGHGEVVSYGELDRRANSLARRLQRFGAGDSTAVAVELSRSVEQVVATLAIWKAGSASRREFIESVRMACLDAWAHRQVPFDRIVEAAAPSRHSANPPYLQVLFEYNVLPRPVRTADGVDWRIEWLPGLRPKCDLLIAWNESEDGLVVRIEHDSAFVSPAVASEIADGMRDMLSALTMDLDASVSTLPHFPSPGAPAAPLRLESAAVAQPGQEQRPPRQAGIANDHDPRVEVVKVTARQMWREVLEVEDFSDDDDFFELGGHSLKATQLVKKLGAALRLTIPVQLVFTTESFGEFVQRVEWEYRDQR